MRKIKWGVIGCGGIADIRTIPGLLLAENAELTMVMDRNPEVASRIGQKYGVLFFILIIRNNLSTKLYNPFFNRE